MDLRNITDNLSNYVNVQETSSIPWYLQFGWILGLGFLTGGLYWFIGIYLRLSYGKKNSNLFLEPGEHIIINETTLGNLDYSFLILTNTNIIHVKKGFLGKIKSLKKFPIQNIDINNNDEIQMFLTKSTTFYQLEIYFNGIYKEFKFLTKYDAQMFFTKISRLLGATPENQNFNAIPGTEFLAETVKDTINVFKRAFSGEPNKPQKINAQKVTNSNKANNVKNTITKKCKLCGATISGYEGSIETCKYCNTNQQL